MNLYDIAYLLGGCLAAPAWLLRGASRKKVLGALKGRMGHIPPRTGSATGILIHAVSLGEMNATRELVRRLRLARNEGQLHFIITTTTDTGFARGQELYGSQSDVTLVRFPLDFSWAVNRLLESLRPSVAVLMELEVWPNFLRQCRRAGIPVLIINGRLTEASFSRYARIKPMARAMFRQVQAICAQDEIYAKRFIELGADPAAVSVTGTMKFDTAEISEPVEAAQTLARATSVSAGDGPIWLCASTGPGEEAIVLEQYRALLARFPTLRLVIVPRHPQRFDEAAGLIATAGFPCLRRSRAAATPSPGIPGEVRRRVILGDTMGELRAWYSLADVVFVGRTLVDLGPRQHGSDMIEPAALAKPVVVGPFTGNFAEPMAKFLDADAMVEVNSPNELGKETAELLQDTQRAAALGRRAKQVVASERGATDRHVNAILKLL
ncbi:MAG: 3-deoxy-D-manno-octulosonic acid transferase [Tepidisphaeraceae bacterium]|jgi:3-deoxy-D-manno-octulosonic-acid transferase